MRHETKNRICIQRVSTCARSNCNIFKKCNGQCVIAPDQRRTSRVRRASTRIHSHFVIMQTHASANAIRPNHIYIASVDFYWLVELISIEFECANSIDADINWWNEARWKLMQLRNWIMRFDAALWLRRHGLTCFNSIGILWELYLVFWRLGALVQIFHFLAILVLFESTKTLRWTLLVHLSQSSWMMTLKYTLLTASFGYIIAYDQFDELQGI